MTAQAGPLHLMLVRHGQTPSNVRKVLDAAPPGPPLTDEGQAQAAALAGDLVEHPVSAVYASSAVRAQQTAQPVAAKFGLDVRVLDGVHEVDVGTLQGRSDLEAVTEYWRVYTGWLHGELESRMPGGESGREVYDRYQRAVHQLLDRHSGELVVLVSHGGVIRLMGDLLADNVTGELAGAQMLPNTGRVLLEARSRGWRCLEWNGTPL